MSFNSWIKNSITEEKFTQRSQLNLLAKDLNFILLQMGSLWENLRNKRLFITGATGFFGCWLLESFLWANEKLSLNATVTLLTRHKASFVNRYPHLAQNSTFTFLEGDVSNFTFPKEQFDFIIHAATDVGASLDKVKLLSTWNTIVDGTKRVLEFAAYSQAKQILLTSSGAVYGKQTPELSHLLESHSCELKLDEGYSTYAVGKFAAEYLSVLYAKQYNLDIKIARCFTFIGPYLPLTANFAIAQFIRSGLRGEDIIINGDGSPYRSYLYAADLVIWLWTILFKGQILRPYNVGSDQAISIKELALIVSSCFDSKPQVKIMKPATGALPERYVPNVQRAQVELGLTQQISLVQAIQTTINWYTSFGKNYAG
ncbi:NAD-dependent epimerase/dehydratase family protein [Legionella sp. D16C41]|uniref:NAD-dependent epimerase/dehydratase family protein n=1 Tax=Legionella sp. D16C41 TaxID=3402688 RepID=UPI003AF41099